MPEYYFPSGIRITGFNAQPWIWGLQFVFVVLLIGAIAVFLRRCTYKVSFPDVYAWSFFAAAECLLAWGADRYFHTVQDRFSSWQVWTPALLWSFALAFVAVNVTVIRHVNRLGSNIGLLFLEFILLVFLTSPAGGHPREAYFRTACKNNLRLIGLGLYNYHDAYSAFPAAGGTAHQGDFVCSWRISLLPYTDETRLYREYLRDEPWNSTNNAQLQKKRPDMYRCRSCPKHDFWTAYAMLTGPGTIGGDRTLSVKLKDISDGSSYTIAIAEVCGREIIWTEPKDIEVTENSLGVNLPGDQPGRSRAIFSSHHDGGAFVLLADGTVRFLNENLDPAVLKALTTIADGETVPEF